MKNTIFFLFFMTQLTILTGQTVSVGCQGGGTDCFSATLCTTPNGYTALINDDTFTVSKGYTRLIKWTPSGAYNSANPSGDNLNYYVE